MDDLISRSALGIGRCNPDAFPEQSRGYVAGWNGVVALIEAAPAVDAVALEILEGKMLKAVMQKQDGTVVEFLPVVRCKDCKWAVPNEASDNWVNCRNYFESAQRKDWYCADGERREDDG